MDTGTRVRFRLGSYTCVEKLGEGPLGELFRAKLYGPAGVERQFGVRRLPATMATDPAQLSRLASATTLASRLYHEGLGVVHELKQDGTDRYLVVEFIHGLDLSSVERSLKILGERLAPDSAVMIVAEAARALAYAHSRVDLTPDGVVHGSLYPDSIVLSADGEVKLLDVGLLGAVDPATLSSETLERVLPYLSPEVLSGQPAGAWSDVWALGMVLRKLLIGRPLFEVIDPGQLLEHSLAGINRAQLGITDEVLARIVLSCLVPQPTERMLTARDLQQQLMSWLGERAERAKRELPKLGRRLVTRPRTTGTFNVAELFAQAGAAQQNLDGQIGLREQSDPNASVLEPTGSGLSSSGRGPTAAVAITSTRVTWPSIPVTMEKSGARPRHATLRMPAGPPPESAAEAQPATPRAEPASRLAVTQPHVGAAPRPAVIGERRAEATTPPQLHRPPPPPRPRRDEAPNPAIESAPAGDAVPRPLAGSSATVPLADGDLMELSARAVAQPMSGPQETVPLSDQDIVEIRLAGEAGVAAVPRRAANFDTVPVNDADVIEVKTTPLAPERRLAPLPTGTGANTLPLHDGDLVEVGGDGDAQRRAATGVATTLPIDARRVNAPPATFGVVRPGLKEAIELPSAPHLTFDSLRESNEDPEPAARPPAPPPPRRPIRPSVQPPIPGARSSRPQSPTPTPLPGMPEVGLPRLPPLPDAAPWSPIGATGVASERSSSREKEPAGFAVVGSAARATTNPGAARKTTQRSPARRQSNLPLLLFIAAAAVAVTAIAVKLRRPQVIIQPSIVNLDAGGEPAAEPANAIEAPIAVTSPMPAIAPPDLALSPDLARPREPERPKSATTKVARLPRLPDAPPDGQNPGEEEGEEPTPAPGAREPSAEIESEPIGATIYIDGTLRGITPARLNLPLGRHRLVLSLPGRRLLKRDFQVGRNENHLTEQLVATALPDKVGRGANVFVRCRTVGELRIFIDSFDSGVVCPNKNPIAVGPGAHRIKVMSPRTGKFVEVEREIEGVQYPAQVFINY